MISNKSARMVIYTLLILLGIVWIYPFIWMILSSLKENTELLIGGVNPIPETLRWENFSEAWTNANFSGYFMNTTIITLSTVLIVLVLSALTGYSLGRVSFPGRKVVIICIAAIMFVPKGYTIIPLFQLVDYLGLTNTLLGVILAESSGFHVLFVLMFASFFSSVPKELEEAAIMDGCGFLKTFYKVMLPLSLPIIATTTIMQFIWSWNSFLTPLVLTISKPELRTLAVGMQSFVEDNTSDMAGMAAGATISLLPVIIIFIVMQKYFIEGVAGAVKQ